MAKFQCDGLRTTSSKATRDLQCCKIPSDYAIPIMYTT